MYLDNLERKELVFATGPAGTGKTYLEEVAAAVNALLDSAGREDHLGGQPLKPESVSDFCQGSLVDKVNPYLRPLHDALFDLLGMEHAGRLMDNGTIEVAPLAFMRGRTLSRAFVILDEAQNTTTEQMKMFLTRLGHGSGVAVTGDVTQVDLPRGQRSGLLHAIGILKDVDEIGFVELQSADVVRHGLVRSIVTAYEKLKAKRVGDSSVISILVRPTVRGLMKTQRLRRRVNCLLRWCELAQCELSIVLTDDAEIAELNAEYRGKSDQQMCSASVNWRTMTTWTFSV